MQRGTVAPDCGELFEKHRWKQIVFSENVARTMGLRQEETAVRIGMESTRGALVSATMDNMVVLAKMSSSLNKALYSARGLVIVHLSFYDSLLKKDLNFNLFTKFHNMHNRGLPRNGTQYVTLAYRRRIPAELISVFGNYHEKTEQLEKRKTDRFEGMLFARGIKRNCSPTAISDSTLMLCTTNSPLPFSGYETLIVLKDIENGNVYEITGRIDSGYRENKGLYLVKLNYSMARQKPEFVQTYRFLRERINKN